MIIIQQNWLFEEYLRPWYSVQEKYNLIISTSVVISEQQVNNLSSPKLTERMYVVLLLPEMQLTPDNSNPRKLGPHAYSNQNRFPQDFRHTFTVILPSVTRTLDNWQ